MQGLANDVRYSLRQLAKNPVTTSVAIVSLMLGIGANTAIFSLINALMLRPLPIHDPGQLVRISLSEPKNPADREKDLSLAMFQQVRSRQSVFASMFAWSGGGISNVGANGSKYPASVSTVSGEYFSTLGIPPHLGRFILPTDLALETGQPAAVAVIDYQCWKKRYDADPAVIGKTILVEDRPLTIIGVAPEGFTGLIIDSAAEVTVPIGFSGRTTYRDRKQLGLEVYARLNATSPMEQAQAQLESIWPGVQRETMPADLTRPERDIYVQRRIVVKTAATGSSFLRQQYGRPLLILMAMVCALLLIACVNLANLMLARAAARKSEFATRLALGATRWRLTRQILIESLLLSAAGASLGLLLARFAGEYLLSTMWSGFVPLSLGAGLDLRVLAFTVLATLSTGILFGLFPAGDLAAFRENSRSVHGGSRTGRWLIPVQIAVSLVLVVTALLFVRSLHNLRTIDLGFRNEGILMVQLFPQTGSEAQKMPGHVSYYRELAGRVLAIPGVEAVSYSHMGPLLRYESTSTVSETGSQQTPATAVFELAGPGFFKLAGMRLQAGRDFSWADAETAPGVAVISESLARRLFPSGGAVGRRINYRDRKGLEVVGVVNSASLWMPESRSPMAVYLAFLQEPTFNSSMLDIRTHGAAAGTADAVKQILASMGRHYALRTQTIEERSDRLLATQRIVATLASFYGSLAMLLAAIGLYGVLSQAVARRTAEIGIRMAVGARPNEVSWMIVKDAMWMVLTGAIAGIPASLAVSRLVAGSVFGASATDPGIIPISLGILGITTLLAALVPARRAAGVSPMKVLKV